MLVAHMQGHRSSWTLQAKAGNKDLKSQTRLVNFPTWFHTGSPSYDYHSVPTPSAPLLLSITMPPMSALQDRIRQFESLNHGAGRPLYTNGSTAVRSRPSYPPVSARVNTATFTGSSASSSASSDLLGEPISPTASSYTVIKPNVPYVPRKPRVKQASPSPPSTSSNQSLIDLKDWIVTDGPNAPANVQVNRNQPAWSGPVRVLSFGGSLILTDLSSVENRTISTCFAPTNILPEFWGIKLNVALVAFKSQEKPHPKHAYSRPLISPGVQIRHDFAPKTGPYSRIIDLLFSLGFIII